MDHIHFVGHTNDLFHPVSVLVVLPTHCRLLFYSLLLNVPVDRKFNKLTLDSFLFPCCILCSCLFLCLFWLVVLAAIVVFLWLFLCCSYRSLCHIRSLFPYCFPFLRLCPLSFRFLFLCLCMLLLCPLALFRRQGYF